MRLKQKFLLRDWGLVAGLLLVGSASLWGLNGLRQQVHVTQSAYADMGLAQVAAQHARIAAEDLGRPAPDLADAQARIHLAIDRTTIFMEHEARNYNTAGARDALNHLRDALSALSAASPQLPRALSDLTRCQDSYAAAVQTCRHFIEIKDRAAGDELWDTMRTMGGIILAVLACATITSIVQYRDVMLPLERLREGVGRVARAQFKGAVEEKGPREFVELAREFNSMAAQLDRFYRKLEAQVLAKSRELVRSERLASVGFLAAGVAHEINNPLNIISGYAELSLKRLTARVDEASVGDTLQVLQIIRSESFRCKEITGKLLSLAKGSNHREPLALDTVARDVAVLAGGLTDYKDRIVELRFDGPLRVVANQTEMKQVLLNLTVNALQAVKPGDGKVLIEGRRRDGWIELSVCDNGCGISSRSLKNVFEPFYSRRPEPRAPGTGLGLSITHAIIENHGGRIRAESPGRGLGSRFTVELPAVNGEGA